MVIHVQGALFIQLAELWKATAQQVVEALGAGLILLFLDAPGGTGASAGSQCIQGPLGTPLAK